MILYIITPSTKPFNHAEFVVADCLSKFYALDLKKAQSIELVYFKELSPNAIVTLKTYARGAHKSEIEKGRLE